MKKNIIKISIFLFLCLIAVISYADEIYIFASYGYPTDALFKNGLLVSDKDGTPITGTVRRYHDDETRQQLWWEQQYKSGKQHGISKSYFKDGKLEAEERYKDGMPVSETRYYDNGFLRDQIDYANNTIMHYIYYMKKDKVIGTIKRITKMDNDPKISIEVYNEEGKKIAKKNNINPEDGIFSGEEFIKFDEGEEEIRVINNE